jgi:GT2 family glycosyltransferase
MKPPERSSRTAIRASQAVTDERHREAVMGARAVASVCALLTCFNRRDKTLECLRALAGSSGLQQVALSAVLVDDGSTDGTAEAVRAEFAWVEVVRTSEPLFWCRGMHLAFETALRSGFDHYLWLNDDTVLMPDAVARLLTCASRLRTRTDAPVIVVGSTVDPVSGGCTYGGERWVSRWGSFRCERIAPADVPQRCDTLTGNIVLVPALAAQRVGNLDPSFEHAMGDTDYGLRAASVGVEIWVDSGVHGGCAHNALTDTYRDEALPLATRWKRILNRKGLPWKSWLVFTRRHMGFLWPLVFVWPYAKLLFGGWSGSRWRSLLR